MRLRSCAGAVLVGGACVAAALPATAHAETLADAIAYAYETNPTLLSQRAQLQATDETYVQARAGFRPTASGQASAAYSKTPQLQAFGGGRVQTETDTATAILALSQNLYTGGRTIAQVRVAEAQIHAGREQLRAVETTVLQGVVTAYCDVLRDRETLAIQRIGLKELSEETDEIRARFEAGANTVTDVSQAQTQLEAARAMVQSAQAQLEVSNAEYVADVGRSPADLAPLQPLPDLPGDLDRAFDVAEQENPSIRQAEFAEAAARANIQEARAGAGANLALSGQFGYTGVVTPFIGHDYQRAVSVTATLTKPIFTGGVIESEVRQATAQDTAARVQVEATRRNAVQGVSQAWAQRRAAQANAVVDAAQVQAARATFDGMRVEYRAGLRQTLDVLIAQETLTGARISLTQAVHDEYVTGANLLAAVGRLEARTLIQGDALYEPSVSFKRVQNRGSVLWEAIPEALDKLGEPSLPQPVPLPTAPHPTGPIRMAPAAPSSPQTVADPASAGEAAVVTNRNPGP